MSDKQLILPYCSGVGVKHDIHVDCPLKKSCAHYKEAIDNTKEIHLAWPPFNIGTGKCGDFLEKVPIEIWKKVTDQIRKNYPDNAD